MGRLPAGVPGRQAPAAPVPWSAARAVCFVQVLILVLQHTVATPTPGPFPGVAVSSPSPPHTRLLSVLSHRRTEGHSPHRDGCGRGGTDGDNAFPPGTGPSNSRSKHCCYKLFSGAPLGPPSSAHLWERSSCKLTRTVLTNNKWRPPHCQRPADLGCSSLGQVCLLSCLRCTLWPGILVA